ncbi:uncharacterized protein ofcc1 [Thalassophryne amazonica]|uniref:uncharacterized protein ofcc1 n=1 Tax=Thalassophryne amazonica TaxID=390379 RepID=UPI0014719FE3|nr:uncharacterized protein ofcc1 [Thalassophryne amazonica]
MPAWTTYNTLKLQQKALQQPKQKKSKSAEFLMEREERAVNSGAKNPDFDGGGSAELLSAPSLSPRKEIRGDRPDSTLAARPQKTELQAPSKERGNEQAQNYFDPSPAEQTDPRRCRMAGVNADDELELTVMNADENRLYQRMAALLDEDDTFLDLPGTVLAPGDEEVLEVKAVDPVLQQQLLLHGGGAAASGYRPSQAQTTAKTQAGIGDARLKAGRIVMGKESNGKTRTNEETIPHYAQQLRERVRPDMIALGSLSLQQQTDQRGPWERSEWATMKKRLMAFFTPHVKPHSQRDCDGPETGPPNLQCSTSAGSPSLRAPGEGRQEVMAKVGQVTELLESSSLASPPLWQVNTDRTPQPVDVRICCLRAVRDKLPRGLYTVSVALHSRLGGPALAWCGKKGQHQWAASTEPVEHRGHFYETDLHINQSLFMILPAAREVVPSMVLIFRLITRPALSSHISAVLAWGVFPVCDLSLSVVQGRFKTPLLRGEPSTRLCQFKKIEALISSDLDHWLCNLYFQVKNLQSGTSVMPEQCVALTIPPSNASVMPQTEVQQSQLPLEPPTLSQPPAQSLLCLPHAHPQFLLSSQNQATAGLESRAGEPAWGHSHHGSPLHLSADSACSSTSLPGAISGNTGEKSEACREKADGGIHYKKKPIKKTNSCGPSMSGSSAPPRQADKQTMQPSVENVSTEEMEEYTFSLQRAALTGPGSCTAHLSDRTRLALRMLLYELGLPLPRQQQQHSSWRGSARQLGLIMLLLALMWFVRLYLHYCSQWLYLQAKAVPVNKFQFHAHTVDLIYQSSLLHTREELAMVVVGPLTLNAVTFLLVLIRWGCQQIFGSLPSFTSKFIIAQGVWTVLDPLAVFAVDAVLGRLAYSPDTPVGDAAKLFWHFYRSDQSGSAGVIITLFLYAVHFLLSLTIMFIYLLRFHNDGCMLDVYQRLTAKEGAYFVPQDMELSNQELSYIVKKAEQWRGFNGERRKVTVSDYIWTADDLINDTPRESSPVPVGESSTHVAVYTLYLSGLKQRFRHFLRQHDGAIIEVIGDMDGVNSPRTMVSCPGQGGAANHETDKDGKSTNNQLRKRKNPFGRFRIEPVRGSGCGSSFAPQDIRQ